jgi:apolipoprotein N-acyltransferase
LIPLFWAITGQSGKKAFFYGWLYGFALGLASFPWLSEVMSVHGGLGPWGGALILMILAAYLALYHGIGARLITERDPLRRPLLFALNAALVLSGAEYLKNWVFTGFNWTPPAGSLAAAPRLLGAADLIGVYGLNFPVLLINACLFTALLRLKSAEKKAAALKLLILPLSTLLLLLAYGTLAYDRHEKRVKDAPVKRIAALQASVDQTYKWDSAYRERILGRYGVLAAQAAARAPFLIVWSETAAPFVFGGDPYESQWILDLADRLRIPMLIGVTARAYDSQGTPSLRNRAWVIFPDRTTGPYYDKRHLVPFGEYVPLGDALPFLRSSVFGGILGAAGNFSPGAAPGLINYGGVGFGPLICFESLFPYLARENARLGADVLVVTTNDAWFGESWAPDQHFNHAILRAVETRLPLLRAANNGISGVILPSGRVKERSALNEVKALIYEVPFPEKLPETFFTRGGYLLAPLAAALAILLALLSLRKHLFLKDPDLGDPEKP